MIAAERLERLMPEQVGCVSHQIFPPNRVNLTSNALGAKTGTIFSQNTDNRLELTEKV